MKNYMIAYALLIAGVVSIALLLDRNSVPFTLFNILRVSSIMVTWVGAGFYCCLSLHKED